MAVQLWLVLLSWLFLLDSDCRFYIAGVVTAVGIEEMGSNSGHLWVTLGRIIMIMAGLGFEVLWPK